MVGRFTAMKYERCACLCLVVWVSIGIVQDSMATILETKFDRHLIKEADLIVEGVVSNIDYKESTGDGKLTETLIHTFVTFTVEHIFKGDILTGNTITLRFQGGLESKGGITVIDEIPLFDIGDRDILFVKDNEDSPCPLVGWNQGLFRVINKQEIYSDSGHEIVLADNLDVISLFVKSDFLKPDNLVVRIQDSKTAIDQKIQNYLGGDTRRVLVSDFANDLALKNILSNLLVRDLNVAINEPDLFSEDMVNALSLRDETRDYWKMNRNSTDPLQIMRRNRMLLEDAYGDILLRTPDRIMLWGRYHALDEVLTHSYNDNYRFRMAMTGGDKNQEYVVGKGMTLNDLYAYIPQLIGLLTTPSELKLLPRVPNSNINQPFSVLRSIAVEPPNNYDELLGY